MKDEEEEINRFKIARVLNGWSFYFKKYWIKEEILGVCVENSDL